jgi:hypothetical protein
MSPLKIGVARIVEIGIRRRFLILTTLLAGIIAVPLALVQAPRSYTARALLLLQEDAAHNPLSGEARRPDTSADKISGLRALLRSDRLISEVLGEVRGAHFVNDARALSAAKEAMREAISVDAVGSEFFEIRLRGSHPRWMGRELEIIVARLIESIVSSDVSSSTAISFVEQRHAKRVMEASLVLSEFDALRAAGTKGGDPKEGWTTAGLREEMRVRTEAAKQAAQRLEAAKSATIAQGGTPPPSSTMANDGSMELVRLLPRQTNLPQGREPRPTQADPITIMESEAAARAELVSLMEQLAESSGDGTIPDSLWAQARMPLAKRLQTAEAARRDWLERVEARGSGRLDFMRAPERMVVVDPPRDPRQPSVPRSYIAIVILASAVIFGVGLSAVAELTDGRIQTARRLAAAGKWPVLGTIPWESPPPRVQRGEPTEPAPKQPA